MVLSSPGSWSISSRRREFSKNLENNPTPKTSLHQIPVAVQFIETPCTGLDESSHYKPELFEKLHSAQVKFHVF